MKTIKKYRKVKVIGKGDFGNIYAGVKGRDAVRFLLSKKNGEIPSAFHHKDIGDIDLIWGRETDDGLQKILHKHEEDIPYITEIVENTPVSSKSDNRVILKDKKNMAIIRLQYDGIDKKWVLSAFRRHK